MKRAALLLPLLLAACGQDTPEPTPSPTPTVATPRALVAADFDTLELGAKIEGPQGPEVETVLSAGNSEIGRMVSFVACSEGVTDCKPAALPEGTVYTYVHRVTLSEAAPEASPAPSPSADGIAETSATLFRTTRPATGFNHAIGYSRSEAEAALGDPDVIAIASNESHLVWQVAEGATWKPGSTITFWWTSTVPPQGPEEAYLLEVEGEQAKATGPFPAAADKPVEREPAR